MAQERHQRSLEALAAQRDTAHNLLNRSLLLLRPRMLVSAVKTLLAGDSSSGAGAGAGAAVCVGGPTRSSPTEAWL